MQENKKEIFKDLKKLIRRTKKNINNEHFDEYEKALVIYTGYLLANSLYEKLAKILLSEISLNYNSEDNLSSNNKVILLLKYRVGRKLSEFKQNDIDNFLAKLNQEKLENTFINENKSLKDIKEVFELLIIEPRIKNRVEKILRIKGLTYNGLQDQLIEDYKGMRTALVHGDFRKVKNIFFMNKGNCEKFLDNMRIAMYIMAKATY